MRHKSNQPAPGVSDFTFGSILLVIVLAVCGCTAHYDNDPWVRSQRLRSATGPGGYLDSECNQRANWGTNDDTH